MKTSYKVAIFVLLEAITIGFLYNIELPKDEQHINVVCDVEKEEQEYFCNNGYAGICYNYFIILKYNNISRYIRTSYSYIDEYPSKINCSYHTYNPYKLMEGHYYDSFFQKYLILLISVVVITTTIEYIDKNY